ATRCAAGRGRAGERKGELMRRAHCMALSFVLLLGCSDAAKDPASSTKQEVAPGDVQSSYTATQYPIVLIPGFLGFTKLLGTVEYFTGVADALEQSGARTFQVSVSQAASSQVRGQEIIPQLEALRSVTGATKFNLIGHSQGGIDARYILGERPDLVASVTSVGGPHTGTAVASNLLALPLALGPAAAGGLADFLQLLCRSTDPNAGKAVLAARS